jgi:hypothetical protein
MRWQLNDFSFKLPADELSTSSNEFTFTFIRGINVIDYMVKSIKTSDLKRSVMETFKMKCSTRVIARNVSSSLFHHHWRLTLPAFFPQRLLRLLQPITPLTFCKLMSSSLNFMASLKTSRVRRV